VNITTIDIYFRLFAVSQQACAPAHHAYDTGELLCRETSQFISPDMYPACSSDLTPVDYRIWDMMQERVYWVLIHDVDNLWQGLVETWAEFQQNVMDDANDQW